MIEVPESMKDDMYDSNDSPTSPGHYKLFPNKHMPANEIEALDVIQASLTKDEFKGYLKGNQLKYLLRHHSKNGEEDLRKAKKYMEFYESFCIHVE